MDVSPEYIKMCDCEEIQDGVRYRWDAKDKAFTIWAYGDYFHQDTVQMVYDGNFPLQIHRDDAIWLPRQDQLQEMVEGSPFEVLDKFFGWREFDAPVKLARKASMEQLWLAFCMSEKYNKTWDGDKWA